MEKILLIRRSSHPEEPYKMRFTADGNSIKLRCYCPAGAEQMLCKHVLGLLAGDRDILFPSCDAALFDEAYGLLDGAGAVAYSARMNTEIRELERAFKSARTKLKAKLCDTLREGGSFL
jgi:hypothetical protein